MKFNVNINYLPADKEDNTITINDEADIIELINEGEINKTLRIVGGFKGFKKLKIINADLYIDIGDVLKDLGTIKKHLDTLERESPSVCTTYRELGLQTVPIALAKGKINSERARELQTLLKK